MFKRVEKRQERKEREDELGLDSETKEILGMHDTDSDESDSDSEDSSDGGAEAEELDDDIEDDSEEFFSDSEPEEPEIEDNLAASGNDSDSEPSVEIPSLTISEAVANPIYPDTTNPEWSACIVCPGKLLKSLNAVSVHRESNVCNLEPTVQF